MPPRFLTALASRFRRDLQAGMRIGREEAGSGLAVLSGIPDIEYLDDLSFPEYIEEFRRVANDPQVAKELRSNTLPIISADWTVEAASDDPRDELIAEFVSANILNQGGKVFGRAYWQSVTWFDRLRDILRFLQNGFAIFQKVRRVQGRFLVFDKIKYLQPDSIDRWEFDELDNLVTILRTYTRADGKMQTLEPIEAEDLVIYTWDREGSNILGKPLIRPMWKPYRMKTQLEKMEVIDKQKTAVGFPRFKLQENAPPDDQKKAEDLVKSMRAGKYEHIWAVLKAGQEVGWAEGGTSAKGFREIIMGKDEQISKAGGSRLQELGGEGAGGSRGVAGGIGAFEAMLQTAVAKMVEEQEQQNVVELVDANFANVTAYPRARVSRIDPFEQTRNIPEFVAAIQAGAVKADLETENEIRRRYGFVERAKDAEAPPGPSVDDDDDGDGTSEPGISDDSIGEPPGDDGDGTPGLARIHFHLQAPTIEERAGVKAEQIRGRLETFESQYFQIMKTVRRDMVEALVAAVRSGKLKPSRVGQVKVPFQGDLKERLSAVLRSVRDFGRRELRDETDRQIRAPGERVSLEASPLTRGGSISFANTQSEVIVDLDISNLIQRLQGQTVAEYNRLLTVEQDPSAIADGLELFLKNISDREIANASRASTAHTFNLGRNVAVMELKEQLQPIAVRTEVLDRNTCGPCRRFNGKRVRIGSDQYLKFLPPAFCEGRRRCRGFYLVFPK